MDCPPVSLGRGIMVKMVDENLALTETEFYAFRRFCSQCGFGLCYYGPAIFGSKEGIARYQFERPKVIKLKERRFDFVGIPYDVAEYEQKDWRMALPQLRAEFLSYTKIVKAVDDKPDIRKIWNESWAFFRLAATALSAGFLLALVPVAGVVIPLISLLLFLISVIFLAAEWSRFSKRKWFENRDRVLHCGERITPTFIIISVASVIFSWSKIMNLLYGGTNPQPELTWIQPFYARVFGSWILFFVITLGASVIRTEKSIFGRLTGRKKLKRAGRLMLLAIVVVVDSWVKLTNFIEAHFKDLLIFVLTFLILFVVFYFLREKDNGENGSNNVS
jgi:hypothetical protein